MLSVLIDPRDDKLSASRVGEAATSAVEVNCTQNLSQPAL
jgi:hypothetical protein